jgi:DNA/RNA endonuclease YhcR with UshA esterase domain
MKKILLGVSALMLGATLSTQAQLLTEHFDYTTGTTLVSNGWSQTQTNTTNPISVGANSLTFPAYAPSAIGGSAISLGNGQDISKLFPYVTSGNVYTSFLLRVDTAATGYFFHLMDTAASSAYRARTYFQQDATNANAFNLGLTFNSGTGSFDTTEFMIGDTILVVVKYSIYSGSNNDSVSLYAFNANGSFSTEPSSPLIGPVGWTGTTAAPDIEPGRIALRQFSNDQDFVVDAFMVDTVWNLVPGLAQIDLPITWDDTANVDYTTVAFEGGLSAPDLDPTNSSNNVLRFVKPLGAQPWAGVTLSTTNGLANTIPFTPAANTVSAKVYSPAIGTTLMLKTEVVGSPTVFVETSVTTTVANAWETVVFDFANPSNGTINYANNYSLLSFFPDFLSTAAGDTFYVDSVYFGGTPVVPVVIPTYDIATITTQNPANGEPDSNGVFCWTKGVVMGIDLDGNAGYSFTIWDNDGINIYNSADVSGYVVTEGDSIMVRGTVGQFNGLTQFSPDSIILVNQGNTIPSPTVVSSLSEMYESELVRIENFYVIDNPVNSGSFNVTLSNGSDTVSMRIDSDTDIDGNVNFAFGDTICYIVGIGGQFDNSSPYTSGYQLFPQRASDIDNSCGGILPPPVPHYPIKDINNVDVNGEPDSLGVYCWTKGVVLGIDLDGNAGISFTMFDEEGINVFNFADVSNYVVTEGDSIEVRGSILFYNGLTEITPDSIRLINSGNTVPAPMTYTSLSEETESAPIRVVNVMVVNPAQWGTGNSSFNVDLVTCSGDTIVMRADSDTDIGDVITTAPTGMFTIKGIGGQFDGSSPYLEGYQIFPMSALDIDTTTDYSAPSFFVNEIMSDNDAVIADASGEFDDWAELYNAGTSDVMLAGMFFTDDAAEPMKYQVPSNSTEMIPAGGYALVWCDNETEQGDLHTNFALSAGGEYFGVTSYDGCAMIDGFDFPALATDASFGRITDGADSLVSFPTWSTTPNAMNVLDTVNSVGEFGFEATQLIVYPNPTAANTTVRFNEKITFEVYDVLGNRVASARNTNEFAVANLASGAYLIRTNNGEVIRMIVK